MSELEETAANPCTSKSEFKQLVILPSSLTAENGAKALLSGEFFEHTEVVNPAHCGTEECTGCEHIPFTIIQHTPISWDTIKDIYTMIVKSMAIESLAWQPIESAPKDGTHIQLFRPDIQFVGYYGGANSGWIINAPDLPAIRPLPTHWKPLTKMPINEAI